MALIFPSLISGNLLNLEEQIKLLDPHCAGYHLDIMDFNFVPNLTWGPQFINAIRKATKKQLQLHLMVQYPEKYFDRFEINKNDIVCVHLESQSNLSISQLIHKIKSYNWIPSIAINPSTPIDYLISLPIPLEHILLMSVNPGFSGQQFLPTTLNRLKALSSFKKAHNLHFTIAVDGGINPDNSKELIANGADQLAVASAIFKSGDPVSAIKNLG